MNAAHSKAALAKAREEFQKTEIQARDAERRMTAAQEMGRLARLKFKQTRKWARQTKKLVKRTKAEAAEKMRSLQKAAERLKKLEKKALKKLKKTAAKAKPTKKRVQAKPAKPKKAKVAAKAKPAAHKKPKIVKRAPRKLPAPARLAAAPVTPAGDGNLPPADAPTPAGTSLPPG